MAVICQDQGWDYAHSIWGEAQKCQRRHWEEVTSRVRLEERMSKSSNQFHLFMEQNDLGTESCLCEVPWPEKVGLSPGKDWGTEEALSPIPREAPMLSGELRLSARSWQEGSTGGMEWSFL